MKLIVGERKKTCHSCDAVFSCYTEDCWCSKLPLVMTVPENQDCLCPDCLGKAIQNKSENEKQMKPTEDDYYINEQGLFVYTANYHLKRGYCCGNGCRHCPY